MPRAVEHPLRQQIFSCGQLGLNAAAVARRLQLPERTVRRLLGRFGGDTAQPELAPRYAGCGRRCPGQPPGLRQECLTLRREHPGWGAQRLRLALRRLHPGARLPAARTLQVWMARAGLSPGRVRRPAGPADGRRATEAHQVWQADAAEHIRLRSGDEVSWLRVVDECSGAVLATVLFPPRELAQRAGPGGAGGPARGLRPLGTPRAVARR